MDYFDAKLQLTIKPSYHRRCKCIVMPLEKCSELSGLAGRTYLELSSIATLQEYQKCGAATCSIQYVVERTKAAQLPVYLVVQGAAYGHQFLMKQGFREVVMDKG